MKSFIVFDTETTGVTPADKVCQIAAALVDADTFEVQDSFTSLVDPQREIPAGAFAIRAVRKVAIEITETGGRTNYPHQNRLGGCLIPLLRILPTGAGSLETIIDPGAVLVRRHWLYRRTDCVLIVRKRVWTSN